MTERKPADMNFESWIDKQIREGAERGAFDNLPGAGKPLSGLDKPQDMMGWIKDKVHREGLSSEALLPPSLRLRKEIERLPETVRGLPTEHAVRDVVAELNQRIADWLRAPSGPAVRVGPVDADDVVHQWRSARESVATRTAENVPAEQTGIVRRGKARRRRWLGRWRKTG